MSISWSLFASFHRCALLTYTPLLFITGFLLVGKNPVAKRFNDTKSKSIEIINLVRLNGLLKGQVTFERLGELEPLDSIEDFMGNAYQPATNASVSFGDSCEGSRAAITGGSCDFSREVGRVELMEEDDSTPTVHMDDESVEDVKENAVLMEVEEMRKREQSLVAAPNNKRLVHQISNNEMDDDLYLAGQQGARKKRVSALSNAGCLIYPEQAQLPSLVERRRSSARPTYRAPAQLPS